LSTYKALLNLRIPKNVIYVIHQFFDPETIFIHTQDGEEIPIKIRALGLSKLLSIEAEIKRPSHIHIRKIEGHIFIQIAKYLSYHNGIEPVEIAKPIRSVNLGRCVEDQWDVSFINKLSTRDIFLIIIAANYIDCKSLLHLGCAKIATLIKGRSPEEIKVILSREEKDEVKANNVIEKDDMSICFCGYDWKEDCEELKEEADHGMVEVEEQISEYDNIQGQELPSQINDNRGADCQIKDNRFAACTIL